MMIQGKVRNPQTKAPLIGELVYLSIPSKNYHFDVVRTNAEGEFYFNLRDISGKVEIIIQVKNQNEQEAEIILEHEFFENYEGVSVRDIEIDSSYHDLIYQQGIRSQVENAYYVFKKDSVLKTIKKRFYQKPDAVYRLDDYTRFRKMEEVFREITYTVYLRKRNDRYFVKASRQRSELPGDGEAFVLLDGVPVFDLQTVLDYDPLKVELVEVVGGRYFFGALDSDGIVSIETYTGDFEGISLAPNVIRKEFIGLQAQKIYYQPKYDLGESRIPDFRNQIYWNPNLELHSGQSKTLGFLYFG